MHTGAEIWRVYCGSIVGSPMVAHDDTIYFGSGDRTVTASSYSMSVVPSYFASVVPWYLVSGVSSYLGSGDGTVSWNIMHQTGSFAPSPPPPPPPPVQVWALTSEGKTKWQFLTGQPLMSTPLGS